MKSSEIFSERLLEILAEPAQRRAPGDAADDDDEPGAHSASDGGGKDAASGEEEGGGGGATVAQDRLELLARNPGGQQTAAA